MPYFCSLRYKNAALGLLIFSALVSAALLNPFQHVSSMSSPAPPSAESALDSNAGSNARDAFGRLPLSFEANEGQTDRGVLFLTRSHDLSLFLTADGAVFSFNGTSSPLRMRLEGASRGVRVSGLDQLPGKVNYLVGNKPDRWRTNISTYGRVRYERIYDGVDLVYYGNQRQLEYDFIVAPRASFKQIRLAFDGDGKLKLNRRGDLVWQSDSRNLTLQRPLAYQEIDGNRRTIEARYFLTSDRKVGFHIGKYDRSQPLIIDPVLSFSTYLGGSGIDEAQSIAVDSSGNAYITGATSSTNFPAIPATPANGADVYVTKLNAAGTALVYSTVIGGTGTAFDSGTSIACDNSGNAYVAGQTSSSDFPVLNALHPIYAGSTDAFVLELNASGSAPVFSTFLGGRSGEGATAIALDSAANVYVTGSTSSIDFPTTNPLQALRAGNLIFKTTDAGGNWAASDSGLLASTVFDLTFDPSNSSIIYAATESGIFKTINAGANWTALSGQPPLSNKLAIDPSNPNIIYTAGSSGIFKSIDGGNTFTAINNGVSPLFAKAIIVDPVTPTTLYAVGVSNLIFKSTDGGANWTQSFVGTPNFNVNIVNALLLDPNTPTTIYAATNRGVLKSTNAGGSWATSSTGFPFSNISVNALALDKTNNLLYAGTSFGLFKSSNAGANWTSISGNLTPFSSTLVVPDPTNSSIIYQVTGGFLFKTVDAGDTWALTNAGLQGSSISTLLLNPSQPATLYLGSFSGTDVFVTKLSAGGTSQIYSTYVGGNFGDSGNGIAVDATGNAYIVGNTSSNNFPTANPIQPARNSSSIDAFVTKLNPSGSALVYSTFLGGSSNDFGRGIVVDGSGNAYITGSTFSTNFPTANAFQTTTNQTFSSQEAFVTKINPTGSSLVFSTYLGGSLSDEGFDIAVDSTGSIYVAGNTSSIDFPTAGAAQPARNGPADAFVTKFAPNGQSLIYSTYIGGISSEGAVSLALDSSNNVYVVGTTDSTDFPTLNPLQATNGGGRDAFVTKLTSAPEIALTISDSPDPVFFDTNLTYTINVTNTGDAPATGVTVHDTMPEGTSLVAVNTTTGTCSGGVATTCAIGTLNPGAAATITLVISPPPIKMFSNTAFVTLNEADSFTPNNTVTAQTGVVFADLSIKKNAAQNLVAPGGKLTYSLLVKNLGGITTPATVIDNLPAGTSLISCTTTGSGVCGGSGNNVTVQIPSLAPNQSQAVLLTVGVSPSATAGTVISNTAAISSPVPDTDVLSNSSTAVVTVNTVPMLQKSNGLIAFAADRAFTPVSEPSGIYTVTPAGTGETLFPNVPLNSWRPAWSPDGTKLAFQKFVSPESDISIINADGTGLLKVVNNAAGFRKPMSWSPTGRQIAFIGTLNQADLNGIQTINIVNVDGSGAYKLPGSPGFLNSVDWSPDGTRFLYSGAGVISVINADGSGITQLTTTQMTDDGPTTDSEPHWSPDGTRIIFTRSTTNSNAIYTVNADGTNVAKLFNFGGRQADWSADGLLVVFEQGNEICTAKLDGSDFKCVTNNIYYEFDPHWQELPTASPTPTPTPSPTFSVSGKITTSDSSPFAVQIQISGPTSAVSASNSSGDYSFANLPAGQYTVTPLSVSHSFVPADRTVTITNANITGQDFVGTFVPANITGHVRDNNGNPLSGIKVTSTTGGFPEGSTVTDANGFYSFANVQRGRTYFIQADPFTAYIFVPSGKDLNDLISNQVVDFVGTKQPSNVIAGRVIEAVSGQGLAGIEVSLRQDNSPAASVLTDSNGNYMFGERKSNQSYNVSVGPHPTFDFEPKQFPLDTIAQFQIPSLTSDQNLVFSGARRNVLQFSTNVISVGEAAGSREVVVTRTGDVAGPAFVTYATSDTAGLVGCTVVNGKASERCDYETVVGTLRFAAGETSKSFIVPIVDDAHVEGNETFTLTLSGPVGATLFTTNVVVTITDNDASPSAQNPIDGVQFFVTQQYLDFLGRLPDSVGLANWMATLNGCPNGGFGENENPDCDRVHVSAGFFLSDEFRGRGYWAYRFYEVAFDRRPLYAEFVPDMAQVGGPQSPESELLSKAAYTTAFAQRPEFANRYNSSSNSEFVNALEQNAEITLTNKAALIAALDGNQKTRGDVLREIVESKDVEDRFFIRAFVAMQYFGYLRRDPDTIGYNNWVTTLTQDPGNFRHMIFGFLFSSEYRGRFGAN